MDILKRCQVQLKVLKGKSSFATSCACCRQDAKTFAIHHYQSTESGIKQQHFSLD
jgi:hypothetical protein